jgi:AraC-like DNA-binding protein
MSKGRREQMIDLLKELAPAEGSTLSALDGVRFMRANGPLARTPVLYDPSIIIVVQGRKRAFLGDEIFVYDAQHYLVLALPLPFSAEAEASEAEPLLALSLRLDMTTIADLVVTLDDFGVRRTVAPLGIVSTPLDASLADATLRLLKALASPVQARILAPAIVREICFHVLQGDQGACVRAALANHGPYGRIVRALQRIHHDYAEALDVGQLAAEAKMSAPAFHSHFKAVTRTSPIQYIKSTRLHWARLIMIRDDLTAAVASARVGYGSPSQFSREFRRFFGRSPGEEKRNMKSAFTLRPANRMVDPSSRIEWLC